MKRGQLTNQSLPIIAFNLESCFFNNKTTFVNELFKDKYEILGMQYNPQHLDTIMKIWKSGKYSIHLVTYKDPKEWKELEGFLFEKYLYFNSLEFIEGFKELKRFCELKYLYYVDDGDKLFLPKNAVSMQEFLGVMK